MSNFIRNKTGQRAIDPVCGMTVDSGQSALRASFGDHTYFFCAAACRRSFEADPHKYLPKTPKKKGVWGRYVDRLTKATGGKPPSCCG